MKEKREHADRVIAFRLGHVAVAAKSICKEREKGEEERLDCERNRKRERERREKVPSNKTKKQERRRRRTERNVGWNKEWGERGLKTKAKRKKKQKLSAEVEEVAPRTGRLGSARRGTARIHNA